MEYDIPNLVTFPKGFASTKGPRMHYLKVATMAIGFLMGTCDLIGVIMVLKLLSTEMGPFQLMSMDWQGALLLPYLRKSNYSFPRHAPALQSNNTTSIKNMDSSLQTIYGILNLIIVVMGILNIIHLIMSAQLIIGAYRECRRPLVQWILFTKKATVVYFLLSSFIAIGHFAVDENLLGFTIIGIIFLAIGIISFLLVIVDQYNCMLRGPVTQTFVFKRAHLVNNQ